MNILLSPVTYFPRTGGVPSSVRRLARGLLERGHRVVVVTLRLEPTQPDREVIEGLFAELHSVAPLLHRHMKRLEGSGLIPPAPRRRLLQLFPAGIMEKDYAE